MGETSRIAEASRDSSGPPEAIRPSIPHAFRRSLAQASHPPGKRLLASQCPAPGMMVRSGWVRAMRRTPSKGVSKSASPVIKAMRQRTRLADKAGDTVAGSKWAFRPATPMAIHSAA